VQNFYTSQSLGGPQTLQPPTPLNDATGHIYPVSMADLLNMAAMADVEVDGNVVIFDDYPTLKASPRPFGWAWEDMRRRVTCANCCAARSKTGSSNAVVS